MSELLTSDGQMKLHEALVVLFDTLDGALGLKKKAQGMAIQCALNPLLNIERHLGSSTNTTTGS